MIWTRKKLGPHAYPTTRPLSTRSAEANMPRPARSACHDLYQIFQVLSLHIPQWSSNDAIVWWNVSGRFIGPIKWYADRKSASASRLSRRPLSIRRPARSTRRSTWRCQVCAFSLISIWVASLNNHRMFRRFLVFVKNENQIRYIDRNDTILSIFWTTSVITNQVPMVCLCLFIIEIQLCAKGLISYKIGS